MSEQAVQPTVFIMPSASFYIDAQYVGRLASIMTGDVATYYFAPRKTEHSLASSHLGAYFARSSWRNYDFALETIAAEIDFVVQVMSGKRFPCRGCGGELYEARWVVPKYCGRCIDAAGPPHLWSAVERRLGLDSDSEIWKCP